MEVTQTLNEGLAREYKISLDSSEFSRIISNKLTELSKSVKMDGFRPGKVPFDVLKKKYYDSVKDEEMPKFIENKISHFLNENKSRPIGQPEINNLEFVENEKLDFELKFYVMPEIAEPDYSSVKLEKLVAEIDEKEIEGNLKTIAENNKNYKTKEGKSELGDLVVIDFEGSIDGKKFEGGKGENFDLVLGSKSFIDNFEDQLVGFKANDSTIVSVTFPKNYGQASLAGKAAEFEVVIKEVKASEQAVIDENLATKLGFKTLDDLKAKIKQELESNFNDISFAYLKKTLFDKLETFYNFPAPENLVKQEFDHLWGRANQDHVHDESCNHEHDNNDDNQLKADYEKIAVRRVKLGIVLAEIGRIKNIQISNDNIRDAVMNEVKKYPVEHQHKVLEYYRNNPNALEMLKAPILEDKVVELILSLVEVNETKLPSKKLIEMAQDLK